ncbi:MAG: hypothetical protein K0Q81_677 [Paenibacillus sp.]|jgi:regulator of replication initiation timing|nr:hypothetical protein [Paenibacillus sp.]
MEPVSNADKLDLNKIEESIQQRLVDYPFLKAELKSVTELGLKYQEENRKLREEIDREKSEWLEVMRREQSERRELLQAIQSIQQERDKLVAGLQVMICSKDKWYVNMTSMQDYAAKLLEDIGVGEERT